MRTWTCALVILTIAILAGACATAPTSPAPNATPVPAVAPAPAAAPAPTPGSAPLSATQTSTEATAQPAAQYPDGIPRITVNDAVRELKAGTAIIVDVRTKEQWQAGHVKGALFIPWNELAGRAAELPHDKKIIAYCS